MVFKVMRFAKQEADPGLVRRYDSTRIENPAPFRKYTMVPAAAKLPRCCIMCKTKQTIAG